MPWISNREREYLEQEIAFWRREAARERKRADELFDQVIQGVGLSPVSRGDSVADRALLEAAKLTDQFKELLAFETEGEKAEGAAGSA